MTRRLALSLAAAALVAAAPVVAATVHTNLTMVTPTGTGADVGSAVITDGPKGAIITVDLHGLPPGQRGFHVHEKASCQPGPGPDGKIVAAGAAGPHYDPGKTSHHLGPAGSGHLGDLPRVEVKADGTAKTSLIAPRITDVSQLKGRTLMLHVGGDNYTDTPPLGGGGARMACGVLESSPQ